MLSSFQRDYRNLKYFRVLCVIELIFTGVFTALVVIFIVDRTYANGIKEDNLRFSPALLLILVPFIVNAYFFVCVDSLCKKLEREKLPIVARNVTISRRYVDNPDVELPRAIKRVQSHPDYIARHV